MVPSLDVVGCFRGALSGGFLSRETGEEVNWDVVCDVEGGDARYEQIMSPLDWHCECPQHARPWINNEATSLHGMLGARGDFSELGAQGTTLAPDSPCCAGIAETVSQLQHNSTRESDESIGKALGTDDARRIRVVNLVLGETEPHNFLKEYSRVAVGQQCSR